MKTIASIIKSIFIGALAYSVVVGILWALEKLWDVTIGTIETGTVASYVLDAVIVIIILAVFWGIGNAIRNSYKSTTD